MHSTVNLGADLDFDQGPPTARFTYTPPVIHPRLFSWAGRQWSEALRVLRGAGPAAATAEAATPATAAAAADASSASATTATATATAISHRLL